MAHMAKADQTGTARACSSATPPSSKPIRSRPPATHNPRTTHECSARSSSPVAACCSPPVRTYCAERRNNATYSTIPPNAATEPIAIMALPIVASARDLSPTTRSTAAATATHAASPPASKMLEMSRRPGVSIQAASVWLGDACG